MTMVRCCPLERMTISPYPLSRSRGFSLVELLMVIAIIAILAAILIPVTSSIRKQGYVTHNLANLRALQAANILYAQENDGSFVPVGAFNENGSYGSFWYQRDDFVVEYLEIPDPSDWPENRLSPLATQRNPAGELYISRSYGYNFTELGAYGVANTSRVATINTVADPAQTLAFADALDWQIQMSGANRYVSEEADVNVNQNNAIAYRYDGAAGVVYFDGHTAMLKRADVVDNEKLWLIRE